MMELWFAQCLELLRCLVESCIVNCVAAGPCEGEVAEVDALQMANLSILGEQEWPRWFGDHIDDWPYGCRCGVDVQKARGGRRNESPTRLKV